jgi:hypothetical protein
MHRIGLVLAAILPLPVIVAGAALLMGWPMPAQDRLFYLGVGWVLGCLVCYLGARVVAGIIARFVGPGPKSH